MLKLHSVHRLAPSIPGKIWDPRHVRPCCSRPLILWTPGPIRPLDRPDPALERVAKANGFSLHAGVSCEGHQKDKRERLCRYIARPAVAVPRLSLSSTGKVLYTLKTPYRDGTTQVAFDPVDFIARLAALARARSDPNPGSTSPATMAFLPLITDGADWSHQPNAEKASSLFPMQKSAQPLSDMRQ